MASGKRAHALLTRNPERLSIKSKTIPLLRAKSGSPRTKA